MKRISAISVLLIAAFLSSCLNTGAGVSRDPSSFAPGSLEGEKSPGETAPAVSEKSGAAATEEASRPSAEDSGGGSAEEPSCPETQVSETGSETGELFAPYYALLSGGTYMMKTVESRTAGGEAVPYSVTVYRREDVLYAVIEESYGNKSEYLVKDGELIVLDRLAKTAIVMHYDPSLFSEKTLWKGAVAIAGEGKEKLYETEYDYETYLDETGFSFTLFFTRGVLKRYRSYDEAHKDTIVISLTVSGDMTGACFDIPPDFTVIPAAK